MTKILIGEDDEQFRFIYEELLTREGYEITFADDGLEALDKLKAQTFDLIITDIKMPRMDGLTFIAELQRSDFYREIPFLVCSSDVVAHEKGFRFVSKTDMASKLVSEIEKIFRNE